MQLPDDDPRSDFKKMRTEAEVAAQLKGFLLNNHELWVSYVVIVGMRVYECWHNDIMPSLALLLPDVCYPSHHLHDATSSISLFS